MGEEIALLPRLAHLPRETSSEPRARQFRRVDADGIELYLDRSLGNPEELVIEAKGRRRKHLHAYWDGCAYVV